jgi:hypothetical protein
MGQGDTYGVLDPNVERLLSSSFPPYAETLECLRLADRTSSTLPRTT